jgi:hypothetical protein
MLSRIESHRKVHLQIQLLAKTSSPARVQGSYSHLAACFIPVSSCKLVLLISIDYLTSLINPFLYSPYPPGYRKSDLWISTTSTIIFMKTA